MCQLSCCMSARLKARRLSMSHGLHCQLWPHTLSSAAYSQPAISDLSFTPAKYVSPALTCQLSSAHLTGALETVDLAVCRPWLQLVSRAAVFQLGCHVPSQLQTVSSGAHPSAPLQFFTNQLARLQSVSTAVHCHLLCCPVLHYVRQAVVCQLSCLLSAQLYFVSSACSVLCLL
jgi:hypothetical protein